MTIQEEITTKLGEFVASDVGQWLTQRTNVEEVDRLCDWLATAVVAGISRDIKLKSLRAAEAIFDGMLDQDVVGTRDQKVNWIAGVLEERFTDTGAAEVPRCGFFDSMGRICGSLSESPAHSPTYDVRHDFFPMMAEQRFEAWRERTGYPAGRCPVCHMHGRPCHNCVIGRCPMFYAHGMNDFQTDCRICGWEKQGIRSPWW